MHLLNWIIIILSDWEIKDGRRLSDNSNFQVIQRFVRENDEVEYNSLSIPFDRKLYWVKFTATKTFQIILSHCSGVWILRTRRSEFGYTKFNNVEDRGWSPIVKDWLVKNINLEGNLTHSIFRITWDQLTRKLKKLLSIGVFLSLTYRALTEVGSSEQDRFSNNYPRRNLWYTCPSGK
jgi:hypothetical protein